MYIYICIFLIIFSFSFFNRKDQIYALFFSCIFLCFFIGFRHEIGADWGNYTAMHSFISHSHSIYAIYVTDPAYGLLNYYFKGEDGIYYVNLVCAFFLILGVYKICKQQPHPIASLLVFMCYTIFVVGMGYTRQAAGIGLSCIALSYLVEKRFFIALLSIALGVAFHSSAIITLLFFVFFIDFKSSSKYFYILVVISAVVLGIFFWNRIYSIIRYYNNSFHSSGGVMRHLMNVIPSVIFLMHTDYFKKKIPQFFTLLKVASYLSLFLFAISPLASTLSDRFAQYLTFVQALVYPAFIYKFTMKDRAVILSTIVAMYFIFLYYWFSNSNFALNFWIPYQNFLLLSL